MGYLTKSGMAGYCFTGKISQVKMMTWFPGEKVPGLEQGR